MTNNMPIHDLSVKDFAKDHVGMKLIGAAVEVHRKEEVYIGIVNYVWKTVNKVGFAVTKEPITTAMFVFEGGARMDFKDNEADTRVLVRYPR